MVILFLSDMETSFNIFSNCKVRSCALLFSTSFESDNIGSQQAFFFCVYMLFFKHFYEDQQSHEDGSTPFPLKWTALWQLLLNKGVNITQY